MLKKFMNVLLILCISVFSLNTAIAEPAIEINKKETGKVLKTKKGDDFTQIKTKKRSIINFKVDSDITDLVDDWAIQNKFTPVESEYGALKYKRGNGFTSPISFVKVIQKGQDVNVQAWLDIPMVTRIFSIFILPGEMHVHPGGFRGFVPRRQIRNKLDRLLVMLGQEPVKK